MAKGTGGLATVGSAGTDGTYTSVDAAGETISSVNRYSDTQSAALRAALGGVAVTNELSPRTLMYAAANMLRHAEPITILEKFAQVHPMPANSGQTIKFRRAKPLPVNPAGMALVEGVTPNAQKMSYEDVATTLKQYGTWMELTDVIQDTHEDNVLKDMTTLLGEQAAETKEMLHWGVLTGGTNVQYTGTGITARNAVKDPLDLNTLRSVVRTLKNNRARMTTKMLAPSPNISTKYVEAGWIAIGHTDLEADIRQIAGFIPVAGYGSRQPLSEYEIGSVENIRFILSPMYSPIADAGAASSTMMSTTGANADVYQMMVMGQDFYGSVPLRGKDSIKTMVRNPGSPTDLDPLGQRGTIGNKFYFASLILNQAWGVRIECSASKL